jgi:divalent metal cation (Fe/Co/Zn/Cd) transporter
VSTLLNVFACISSPVPELAAAQSRKFHRAIILTHMASVLQIAPLDTIRRIQRVQTVTIAWMSVEAAVSLFAAWRADSPALLAFGGDSAIELFSAVVVLWRFRASAARGNAERRAARVAGALLFALAAYVAVTSVTSLLGYSEPKPTFLGIAILVAAAAVMPWLAKEKRRLSGATGSAALRADATQSALCAYLSLVALAGLAINAIWHVRCADPIAALAVLPLIVWEGWEAMRGKACGCC